MTDREAINALLKCLDILPPDAVAAVKHLDFRDRTVQALSALNLSGAYISQLVHTAKTEGRIPDGLLEAFKKHEKLSKDYTAMWQKERGLVE